MCSALLELASETTARGILPTPEALWRLDVDEVRQFDQGWRPDAAFMIRREQEMERLNAISMPDLLHRFDAFRLYEVGHTRLTTYVVAPAMMIELGTGLWLLWQRPVDILPVQVRLGIGLLGLIWLSTVFVQVPHHERLTQGFDPIIHRKLVTSNWLRTLAWSARATLPMDWPANTALGRAITFLTRSASVVNVSMMTPIFQVDAAMPRQVPESGTHNHSRPTVAA